jgi:hypothetical protein
MNYSPRRDGNAVAIAWVTAKTSLALPHRKTAKAADFHSAACHQCSAQCFKNEVDGKVCVVFAEVAKTCSQFVD